MGIDFRWKAEPDNEDLENFRPYPERPHWSYSGFNRFRARLGKMIGIELRQMVGFGSDSTTPWDTVRDPIALLLNHSDCDGVLLPEECALVAPRLRELLSTLDATDYDVEHGTLLAQAMEDCVEHNFILQFC